jgi:hypothetical protein
MYVILSERIGTPGAIFDPTEKRYLGANIEALLAGGFIGEPSPTKGRKTDKTVSAPNAELIEE